MNQLSWMLYIAELVGTVNLVLWAAFAAFSAVGVILVLWYLQGAEQKDYRMYKKRNEEFEINEPIINKCQIRMAFFVAVILLIVATVVPSKQTIYAIAASQAGEQILKTPLASKAEKALDSWLDAQIKKDSQ